MIKRFFLDYFALSGSRTVDSLFTQDESLRPTLDWCDELLGTQIR